MFIDGYTIELNRLHFKINMRIEKVHLAYMIVYVNLVLIMTVLYAHCDNVLSTAKCTSNVP